MIIRFLQTIVFIYLFVHILYYVSLSQSVHCDQEKWFWNKKSKKRWFRGGGWWRRHWKRIVGHFHSAWRWGGCCFSVVVVGRVGQRGGGGCGLGADTERMALTHIYIYIYIHVKCKFDRVAWLCDFLVSPHLVCHVYVFVFMRGKIYPNKKTRVYKF